HNKRWSRRTFAMVRRTARAEIELPAKATAHRCSSSQRRDHQSRSRLRRNILQPIDRCNVGPPFARRSDPSLLTAAPSTIHSSTPSATELVPLLVAWPHDGPQDVATITVLGAALPAEVLYPDALVALREAQLFLDRGDFVVERGQGLALLLD